MISNRENGTEYFISKTYLNTGKTHGTVEWEIITTEIPRNYC